MTFYKYRFHWSWGTSPAKPRWFYCAVPDGIKPSEHFEDLMDAESWSDKFRGVTYRKVKPSDIPKEWWDAQLALQKQNIKSARETLKTLKESMPSKWSN